MSKAKQTILRNIFYILVLQMLCFPFGIFLWLWGNTWHIFHIYLGMGYLYSIVLIYDTLKLINEHIEFKDKTDSK